MSEQNLVRMANQIAAFFAAYPHEEAVHGVADHIKKFWTPDMRRDFRARVQAGDPDLTALTREAGERLAEMEVAASE